MEPFLVEREDWPPAWPEGLPGSLKKLAVRLLVGVCFPDAES